MLEELSKNNSKWLKMAYNICGDYNYSKDVVQEMYLKIYENSLKNPDKVFKDVYVWQVITNIIKDNYKTNNKYKVVDVSILDNLAVEEYKEYELDDTDLNLLERFDSLRHLHKECIKHSYDKSLREIETMFGVNYGYVYRTQIQGRKEVLRDRYSEYKNKRNKRL